MTVTVYVYVRFLFTVTVYGETHTVGKKLGFLTARKTYFGAGWLDTL